MIIKNAETGKDIDSGYESATAAGGPTLSNLLYSTRYAWNVVPLNDFGRGPSSPTYTFTTQAPPQPKPTQTAPEISVTAQGAGKSSVFLVSGSGFLPDKTVTIRVVDDNLKEYVYHQSSDSKGGLTFSMPIPCIAGLALHFSATDGRDDPKDFTGVLWSNTFTTTCP